MLRFAMRSIGGRFQLDAREFATPGMLRALLRQRTAERPLEHAVADQVVLVRARAVVVECVGCRFFAQCRDRR